MESSISELELKRFIYQHPVIQDRIPMIQDIPCMHLTPKELVEEANHLHERVWELEQENQKLKKALTKFIWPPDGTEKYWQEFKIKSAKLAGCEIPKFLNEFPEVPND